MKVNGKDDIPYMKWKIKTVWNHQPDTYCGWYSTQNTSTLENISRIQYRSHTTRMIETHILYGKMTDFFRSQPGSPYNFHGKFHGSFHGSLESEKTSRKSNHPIHRGAGWLQERTAGYRPCTPQESYSTSIELPSWSMALMTELFQRCLWINHTFKPLGGHYSPMIVIKCH